MPKPQSRHERPVRLRERAGLRFSDDLAYARGRGLPASSFKVEPYCGCEWTNTN
jgi:hypothetical protein